MVLKMRGYINNLLSSVGMGPGGVMANVPSVKQGGIKYHFLSLWFDSTWDWTPVYRTIGEHSTH